MTLGNLYIEYMFYNRSRPHASRLHNRHITYVVKKVQITCILFQTVIIRELCNNYCNFLPFRKLFIFFLVSPVSFHIFCVMLVIKKVLESISKKNIILSLGDDESVDTDIWFYRVQLQLIIILE